MFVRNDRGPEPSVHLSLLSLMEELLLPPEHSLSSPPLRTEERSESREEREEGATETRDTFAAREADGKERSRNGAGEEREPEQEESGEGGGRAGNGEWDRCTEWIRDFSVSSNRKMWTLPAALIWPTF